DIRDRAALDELFRSRRFDLIVHCAAQPSHDKARDIPILDFEVNALGTINLLEATRQHSPEAVFVFLSTNKVYGDAPNEVALVELPTRWEYAHPEDFSRHLRKLPHRSHASLSLRRIQSRRRLSRTGIRPLLQNERRRFSRRLPH